MRVSIMQPAYLPWLGYFDRIARSDIHVVLDHVQFEKNSFTNRNKVRNQKDWCWMTVPVSTSGLFGSLPIYEVKIANDTRWRRRHSKTLASCYSRAEYFENYAPFFRQLYEIEWTSLFKLSQYAITWMLGALQIDTPLIQSSSLHTTQRKENLVLEICRLVNATEYISGPLGRDYLDRAAFEEASIKILFHDYKHPQYRQAFPGFQPYMSSIDLLFNQGPAACDILSFEQELAPA